MAVIVGVAVIALFLHRLYGPRSRVGAIEALCRLPNEVEMELPVQSSSGPDGTFRIVNWIWNNVRNEEVVSEYERINDLPGDRRAEAMQHLAESAQIAPDECALIEFYQSENLDLIDDLDGI